MADFELRPKSETEHLKKARRGRVLSEKNRELRDALQQLGPEDSMVFKLKDGQKLSSLSQNIRTQANVVNVPVQISTMADESGVVVTLASPRADRQGTNGTEIERKPRGRPKKQSVADFQEAGSAT